MVMECKNGYKLGENMIKKSVFIVCITFVFLVFSVVCKADNPPRPESKFYTSENKKFTFVLLLSESQLNILKDLIEFDIKNLQGLNIPVQKKVRLEADIYKELTKEEKLKEKYQKSGLYLNGNPQKLVWAYDWQFDEYLFGGDIKVANDGIHLVQKNGWIRRKFQENAPDWEQEIICFVNSGSKIRSYKTEDLISEDEKIEATASGFYWNRDNGYINNENKTFTIKKVDGKNLIFNIETGDLISGEIPRKQEVSNISDENYPKKKQTQENESSNKTNTSYCLSIVIIICGLVLSNFR